MHGRRDMVAFGVAALGSLLVHGLAFVALHWAGTLPAMDFSLQLPTQVEFGFAESSQGLAPDVRAVLDAIPDWQLIVGGAGLDPLRDLERLYIASPDLQRSSLVIAGQYSGDDDLPRRAVASLAAARGVSATWRTRGSIAV